MDKDTLLKALGGTLDAGNYQLRKESEQQLLIFQQQPGFTAYLLDLCTEPAITPGIQISATILFKNRVVNNWIATEGRESIAIQENEKPAIKTKLIETLVKTNKDTRIRAQLGTALHSIVNSEKWDELTTIIKALLNSGDADQINAGLLCLYHYTRAYRWNHFDNAGGSNPVLEDITNELFPILESLTENLLSNDSPLSDEMLYLIVKIFKFTTFSTLPTYIQDQNNLGKWCKYQIDLINKPLPDSVMKEDPEERLIKPRVKAVKWCFANLHRLILRHGGGVSTRNKDSAFAAFFLSTFVPEILKVYWSIIESWSTKNIWLSESSLYHMVAFLEQLIDDKAWHLISGELEAILRHVILPTLNASDETVELYEDDPEEYYRRFFDINRETSTSDVASIGFIYRLSSKKFAESANLLLTIMNETFEKRAKNRDDPAVAKEVEGALRILSTISYQLVKKKSPAYDQIDQMIHAFVYPELSPDVIAKFPYLTARACDTIAMFVYIYRDTNVLQQLFSGVIYCFQQAEHLPIRLTAVDALRTLVDNDAVADHIAPQVPQLMGTLIEMTKTIESDTLTTVMESFVEKFASSLEPYATDLAAKLSEQFLRTAHELLELQGNDPNASETDKEYQASGILNTLATLVVAMQSSAPLAFNLEVILKDLVLFVLENAQVAFLSITLEILESLLDTSKEVSPLMWSLYKACIDTFDTYAYEFFDNYEVFFQTIIYHGFTKEDVTIENPHVQSLITICFGVLRSDAMDPVFSDSAFELIELTITALKDRFRPFLPRFLPEIFDIFVKLKSENAFDGYMLHYLSILKIFFAVSYVDPTSTLQFLSEKQFMNDFFRLWVEHSDDFQSVYGCKLQILSGVSILCDGDLSLIHDQDLIGELTDLVVSNLEVLPVAYKTREEIQNRDFGVRQFINDDEDDEFGTEYLADDYDVEAELEAQKQTPIDNLNVYLIFVNKMQLLQQQNPNVYQEIAGRFSDEQKVVVSKVFDVVNNTR